LLFKNTMTSLLSIASRIEAAVATYVSVRDVTDRAEWKRHFDEEKVSALFGFPSDLIPI
jgi:hypothetical protein